MGEELREGSGIPNVAGTGRNRIKIENAQLDFGAFLQEASAKRENHARGGGSDP